MKSDDNKYKLIGARIKEARESAEISQKRLAELLGFESGTAISLIESGNRKVSVEDLETIAEVLHRDINFFLGKSEDLEDLDFKLVFRKDKELSQLKPKDRDKILDFIEFVKSQNK
jgi:transcriptional regulator with XRE-family HTH domain